MATCTYAKNDGTICLARARAFADVPAHVHVCGIHRNKYAERADDAGPLPEGRCMGAAQERRRRGGRWRWVWCANNAADGSAYCARCIAAHDHVARVHAAAAPPRWDPAWADVPDPMLDDDLALLRAFRDAGPVAAGAGLPDDEIVRIAAEFGHVAPADRRGGLIARLLAAQRDPAPVAPPPPPIPELGRLARDNQNVHTSAVNRATEDGIARLLAVHVPDRKDVLRLVMHAWSGFRDISYNRFADVWFDAVNWYNTVHCRTMEPAEPDKLYRRVFNGLTAYIERVESAETRTELYRRFFQEAEESVGMCCDGHIARLVNVLVGFDDAFRPPVSQGEMIQNRISAISALDVPFEERARQANAFFDEIALPAPERVAWIEALE